MKVIPNAHKKVPMMFRAQVRGRSQLQYLDPAKRQAGEQQDVELWADEWIDKAFAVMALCPQHSFQILTKRAERMRDYMKTRAYKAYNAVRRESFPLTNDRKKYQNHKMR